MTSVHHELILGGARSGKSRTAESRAADWLATAGRSATLIATAWPEEVTGDDEMGRRIERHRADRARRLPELQTVEVESSLGRALTGLAEPRRLIVVDCLTLWITQCLMPPTVASRAVESEPRAASWARERQELLDALRSSASPIVLVSNEIGLGVMPLSPESRAFVDALGLLHQAVAERCARVTLMVAGCEMRVKGECGTGMSGRA